MRHLSDYTYTLSKKKVIMHTRMPKNTPIKGYQEKKMAIN